MLILTRDEAIRALNQVLAAPLTTTIRDIPTEVEFGPEDGMPRSCVAALDNLQPILVEFCTDCIGSVGSDRMEQVCGALRAATAC